MRHLHAGKINYNATSMINEDMNQRTDRHTHRQDNGPIAQGEPFYKQLPKSRFMYVRVIAMQSGDTFETQCIIVYTEMQ